MKQVQVYSLSPTANEHGDEYLRLGHCRKVEKPTRMCGSRILGEGLGGSEENRGEEQLSMLLGSWSTHTWATPSTST